MNEPAEPSACAYICVRARAANAHGDAVIASLPIVPDEVKHRGDVHGENKRWKRTRAMFKTPNVTPDDLETAISHLFDRLHPHVAAFHAIRDAADLWLAVVIDPIAARYRLRLTPHMVAWLRAIHAARDGAVGVGILLKRLRANRDVWRAIRSRENGFAEVRVQHWANARRVGAWLCRRDVRRMAKLDAGFFYQVIADPKPSFREDGGCNHCAYVQPWSAVGGLKPD